MLTARRFATVARFLVFKRPDRNRMYLKLRTLLRYYLPQPSFRCHTIFFIYKSLIRTLIKIKNLCPDKLC